MARFFPSRFFPERWWTSRWSKITYALGISEQLTDESGNNLTDESGNNLFSSGT